ncbi:hypothetical protein GQ600_6464 [Phytophthora cactorum]|nr:hypothetical protein GQ600_6464 [Phytophthora cactorum]
MIFQARWRKLNKAGWTASALPASPMPTPT